MRRALLILVTVLLGIAMAGAVLLNTTAGQDALLERAISAAMRAPASEPPDGGLRVFMCGTASPLPVPGRAQACVAVQVDDRLFIVDAGAGSANVATLGNLPMERLQAILLSHFHSDHISGIADHNLVSWAAGREAPLQLIGPTGVARVADGFNEAFALDRGYRVAHHGADFMPPQAHRLQPRAVQPGIIYTERGLVIRAFEADHAPVHPALGYRFEYAGRSVVITGDTVVTPEVRKAATGADLVLIDSMSLTIVQTMEQQARGSGRERPAHILADIQDYHADTGALAELASTADIGILALYHLVPAPRNAVMARIFTRDMPGNVVLTEDGMIFDLPASGGILQR